MLGCNKPCALRAGKPTGCCSLISDISLMVRAKKSVSPMPARVLASFASLPLLGLLTPLPATEVTPARLASVVAPTSMSAGGASSVPVFSGDGCSVVFLSDANNLVTNDDRTPYLDVFAHKLD